MIYNLRAAGFNWDTTSRKWKLRYVIERTLNPINEKVSFHENKLMNYNFQPIDLRKDDYLKDQMTTRPGTGSSRQSASVVLKC